MDISTEEGKALWMVTAVVMSHGGQLGVCVCVVCDLWFSACMCGDAFMNIM